MNRPVRTVFLGSGAFAVPILAKLAEHPAADVVAVVTAPPRPSGRGRQVRASPVGAWASEMGLPVLTPVRLRAPEVIASIDELGPELLVLADYGQIVPRELLESPLHGALNLHPSLLPRHRGATPVPAAILAGDARTGVTLMRMDEGLDTGPIVAVREVPLNGDEVAPELEAHLAGVAAELLREALPSWLSGESRAVPQSPDGASLTRPLRRADGRLDPLRPARELERQVRAFQPWPGSFLENDGERLVVWRTRLDERPSGTTPGEAHASPAPGTLLASPAGPVLTAVDGSLVLTEVQPAGGRRMDGAAWLRGRGGSVRSHVGKGTLG